MLLSVVLYKQIERFLAEMEGFKEWDNRPYVTGDNIPGKYYLDHLHFHWGETDDFGSEDTIDGKRYSMELHLPHFLDGLNKSEALRTHQGIAVIGIFLRAAPDGEALEALEGAFTQIKTTGKCV
ncbi:hypothetical protein TELCIR_20153 [Teladorsagia circumcincta]|uniref:carbonic anhydrase n=1 Tax=Teladorsagia circumcincta TaxID=45464 RepID=A0A2G9TKA2_TELCI|nr:hypothetical protein TELCIR_20153 [Teladorsagia circumcincta]